VRELSLTCGMVAVVDDKDFDLLAGYSWSAVPATRPKGLFYAVATVRTAGKSRTVYMHRLITGAPADIQVDHKDRNGLHNWRGNLRLATQSQNNANAKLVMGVSGYRGVWKQPYDRWSAQIECGGVVHRAGRFGNPEEAARAYDKLAKSLFGEFATLNFPGAVS
jgi:hypothetical protein